jgi:hypothetical protein
MNCFCTNSGSVESMQQQATDYLLADTSPHIRQVYTSAQGASEEDIGGAIVGSLVGLTLVVLVLVWCRYRHKVRNHTRQRSNSFNRPRAQTTRHRGQINLPNISSALSATPLPIVPSRLTVNPPSQSAHLEPQILQRPQCTHASTISATPSTLSRNQHPAVPLPVHVAQSTFAADRHQLRPGESPAEGSASMVAVRTTKSKFSDQRPTMEGKGLMAAMELPTKLPQPVAQTAEPDPNRLFVPGQLKVRLFWTHRLPQLI